MALSFLGIEMETDLSSHVATAEFSKLADIWSAALSQHHLLGFELVPGATMGDPTHDKVMWKRTVKQGFRTQQAP